MNQLDRIESMLTELLAMQKPKRVLVGKKQPPTEAFLAFWNYYPRKVGKPAALKSWNGLNELEKNNILSVIPDWVDAWKGTSKEHIPHPSTWLNGRRFNDEIADALPEPDKKPRNQKEKEQWAKSAGFEPRSGESWDNYFIRAGVPR